MADEKKVVKMQSCAILYDANLCKSILNTL